MTVHKARTNKTAQQIYETYCQAVGGKAFNGDPLPDWATFRADPTKQKQSDAWMAAAGAAMTRDAVERALCNLAGVDSPVDSLAVILESNAPTRWKWTRIGARSTKCFELLKQIELLGWFVGMKVTYESDSPMVFVQAIKPGLVRRQTLECGEEIISDQELMERRLVMLLEAVLHSCEADDAKQAALPDPTATPPQCSICHDTGRLDTGVPLTYLRCSCAAGIGRALQADLPVPNPLLSAITDDPTDPRIQPYRGPEEPGPQNKAYLVLSEEERSKGFVRPVRAAYVHANGKCKGLTTMGRALAETYARDPKFYAATYCVNCRAHFPVGEFLWDGTNEKVGS